MPDHKAFKLQKLVNFQKFSTLRVKASFTMTSDKSKKEHFTGIAVMCVHCIAKIILATKSVPYAIDYLCAQSIPGTE